MEKEQNVVVGGGMGGLSCACTLSEQSKITIIEQSNFLGGRCSSRTINDCKIDIGAFMFGSKLKKNLRKLNINLDFIDVKFKIFQNNLAVTYPPHIGSILEFKKLGIKRRDFINFLIKSKIHQYFEVYRDKKSFSDLLHTVTDDPKMRNTFKSLSFLWGMHPKEIPANHFNFTVLGDTYEFQKPVYPIGGSGVISNSLREKIEQNNGSINFSTKAKKIIIENGKAIGVETNKGDFLGDNIILNTNPTESIRLIGKKNFNNSELNHVNRNTPQIGILSVFFGVESTKIFEKKVLMEYNISANIENEHSRILHSEYTEDMTFAIELPSNIDNSLAPKGSQCGTLMMLVNAKDNKLKKNVDMLVHAADKKIHNFEKKLIWHKTFSPEEYKIETGTGTIVGIKETTNFPKRDYYCHTQNLFFVGDSVKPSISSVTQAMDSGTVVANFIKQPPVIDRWSLFQK